ncbi:tipN [uncultured Brevundimonas sp.]|uniref:tipN n=1 Tax=uncultured Brevundimonas sp. TaxID=213418 RepID=UPI00262189B8|nr:tipN [uncultured Brevundimonas sp.]
MTHNHRPETSTENPATENDGTQHNAFWGDEGLTIVPKPSETTEPAAAEDPYARPMSERQRRRLAEQQRQAELRVLEAERQSQQLSPLDEAANGELTTANETSPTVAATKVKGSKKSKAKSPGGSIYILAIIASALWIGGIASWFAYEFGAGLVDLEPIRIAVYALIAIAPAGLFFMLAHSLRLGGMLAQENRRARELADAMVAPTVYGAEQTSSIVQSLRGDIDEAANMAERARQELTALRESLLNEATRLTEAARTAQTATQNITRTIGDERQLLATLGESLDTKALSVADAVQRQAQMVADASDLAQAQLREAEAALAARAADLAAAATEAQDAARVAAEDLSRQTLRLETAGTGVSEQIKAVEDGLSQQRAALVNAAYSLRTDQEDFAAQIESQRAQFVEHLVQTRTAAADLNNTGDQIAESIKKQVEAVIEQFRSLVGLSQREAEGFDSATKLSLDTFEALATESRNRLLQETQQAVDALNRAASEQRLLAEQALQQAQIRADRLGESLFDAARQADDAAEARIAGAKKIVDETVKLVDITGNEAMMRLENLTRRVTDALSRIEASVKELDTRAASRPEDTAQHIASVRYTAEQSLATLNEASRRAAAEAEAQDLGFQDRVRKNYEMVNEAVRLIGHPQDAAPAPSEASDAMRIPLRPAPLDEAPAQPLTPPMATQTPINQGMQWQINAPHAQPAAPSGHAPEAQAPAANVAFPVLAEQAVSSLRRLGVDPNALLPRARIEDVAAALARQDAVRARQIVRRVAPAAVRSINRRVTADAQLHSEINAFIARFHDIVAEYGDDNHGINNRLATDEGRAFMIFDAAMNDLR